MGLVIATCLAGLGLGWIFRREIARASGVSLRRIARLQAACSLAFVALSALGGEPEWWREPGWWLSGAVAFLGTLAWHGLATAKLREEGDER